MTRVDSLEELLALDINEKSIFLKKGYQYITPLEIVDLLETGYKLGFDILDYKGEYDLTTNIFTMKRIATGKVFSLQFDKDNNEVRAWTETKNFIGSYDDIDLVALFSEIGLPRVYDSDFEVMKYLFEVINYDIENLEENSLGTGSYTNLKYANVYISEDGISISNGYYSISFLLDLA